MRRSFVALFSALIPVVGSLLQIMLVPLLSLGFMIASQSALLQGAWPAWPVWAVLLAWIGVLAALLSLAIGRSRDQLVDWL